MPSGGHSDGKIAKDEDLRKCGSKKPGKMALAAAAAWDEE